MKSILTAAAAACLVVSAGAGPVSRDDKDVTAKKPIGFDSSVIKLFSGDEKTPEIRTLTQEDGVFNATATVAPAKELTAEEQETLHKRYINGADDRFQYSDQSYPWIATGKLYWDSGAYCSGALVGPRHVLTAKHCLSDGAGYWAPAFDNGEPFGRGLVTKVLTSDWEWGTACGFKGDWAVLVLDQDFGNRLGYLGVKYPDPALQDQAIFEHVGYPHDRDNGNRPYRTPGNTVQSFRAWDCDGTGPFYTDTDCEGGQSGGPHFENSADGPMIWGTLAVTFGAGDGVAWAGWGSGNEMLDAVLRARAEFP